MPVAVRWQKALLGSGYASLVPCKIDVTDYDFMATLNNWIL